MRNPAYAYQGPPPVSLAERLEALARDARDVSEEDAEIAEELARQVRDEAEAGAAEAARKAALEARIEAREAEAEKARAAVREAARDAERRAAASAAAARMKSDSSAVSAATTRRRRAATDAAARLPTLFDLEALPDSVVSLVLREMGDYELAATMCASRRFQRIATLDDELWGFVQRKHRRWPRRPRRGETCRAAFQRGILVDAGWRRARFDKKEHRAHSEYAQCVALRGDVFVSGSADKTLAVVGLPPRAPEPQTETSAAFGPVGPFRAFASTGWERVLGRAVGHVDAVTCCRLTGGDAADGGAPTTLFSGDARGEMRVWDLTRGNLFDPYERVVEGTADETYVDETSSDGPTTSECYSIPCVSSHLLSSPATGLPHAQFFDVRDDGGGAAAQALACASERAGAGVHVYDCARFGAATRRFELGAAAYGVAWGGGSLDRHIVYVACDDGIVRRWDARDSSGRPCDASARVENASPSFAASRESRDDPTFAGPLHRPAVARTRTNAARCVSADGDQFAFGSARGTVHVRDARKPSAPLCAESENARWHDDCVNAVALDARLRRVVSGGDDGYVRWRRLPLGGDFEFEDDTESGSSFVLPDDDLPVSRRENDKASRREDDASRARRNKTARRARTAPPALCTGVGALAVAFDHSRVVVGCVDSTVRAYDAVTGEDFVDADALRAAWREVCLRARDAGNLLERPAVSGGELSASLDWGNYRA